MANVTLNTTSGALEMTPGDIYDLFVHVTMPANESVMCYLDVRLPFDESAVMTVHHIEMVHSFQITISISFVKLVLSPDV